MSIWEAIILGLVQGLTEFLPISSSAHLIFFDKFIGGVDQPLAFIVSIHVATLIAVIIFFWREIVKLRLRDLWLLAVGTLPAVVVALLFNDQIEAMFASLFFAALTLVMTGLINIWVDGRLRQSVTSKSIKNRSVLPVSLKQVFWVGVAQAVAIIPGISRSGSTVATGVGLGLDRQLAFRLSFLLSVPAIMGAMVFELISHGAGNLSDFISPPYLLGMFMALIGGVASLKIFSLVLHKATLRWFGYYAVAVGSLIMLYQILS